MKPTIKPNIKHRADLIEMMHTVIAFMNDERAYESWIYTVPDGAYREDFEWLAENDFEHVQERFASIIKSYGKDGWFVDF